MFNHNQPGNSRESLEVIQRGIAYLKRHDAPPQFLKYAATLLARYLQRARRTVDPYVGAVAALFVASRHPLSYPNPESRENFCRRYHVKPSSMEWYLQLLVETLGLHVLRDDQHFPYFLDPEGVAYSILRSLTKTQTVEHVVDECLGEGEDARPEDRLVESVVDRATGHLNLLPAVFRRALAPLVADLIAVTRTSYDPILAATRAVYI